MRKSVLLGLGGVAILGGWVLKNLLSDKAENAENSANSSTNAENLANLKAKNSAQSEKGCFRDELGEFSQKQFKGDFGGENLPLSENFTHKEKKMTMRDLEALQDEALQDRAWMSATQGESLDGWDGRLIFGETKINDLDELRSNFVPDLLRENLANGRLEKWLENKATLCKNEQKIQAFKTAAEQVKKIARNSTKLEAIKALYEIFHNEKSPKWLDEVFELDIRWLALQAVADANKDRQIAVANVLEAATDYDKRQSVRDAYIDLGDVETMINNAQDKLSDKIAKAGDNASTQEMLHSAQISLRLVGYYTSLQLKNMRKGLSSDEAIMYSMVDDLPEPDEIDYEKLYKNIEECEGK